MKCHGPTGPRNRICTSSTHRPGLIDRPVALHEPSFPYPHNNKLIGERRKARCLEKHQMMQIQKLKTRQLYIGHRDLTSITSARRNVTAAEYDQATARSFRNTYSCYDGLLETAHRFCRHRHIGSPCLPTNGFFSMTPSFAQPTAFFAHTAKSSYP